MSTVADELVVRRLEAASTGALVIRSLTGVEAAAECLAADKRALVQIAVALDVDVPEVVEVSATLALRLP